MPSVPAASSPNNCCSGEVAGKVSGRLTLWTGTVAAVYALRGGQCGRLLDSSACHTARRRER